MFRVGNTNYRIDVVPEMVPVVKRFIAHAEARAAYRDGKAWLLFTLLVGLGSLASGGMEVWPAAVLVFASAAHVTLQAVICHTTRKMVELEIKLFEQKGGSISEVRE